MCADTWIKTNPFNDGFSVKSLHLCIGVEFVEVRNTKCKIGIGE